MRRGADQFPARFPPEHDTESRGGVDEEVRRVGLTEFELPDGDLAWIGAHLAAEHAAAFVGRGSTVGMGQVGDEVGGVFLCGLRAEGRTDGGRALAYLGRRWCHGELKEETRRDGTSRVG